MIIDSPPLVIGSGQAGRADGKAGAASFNQPKALASDGRGNIFVADSGNQCVRVIGIRDQVTTLSARIEDGKVSRHPWVSLVSFLHFTVISFIDNNE
jgi:hypothetical protein